MEGRSTNGLPEHPRAAVIGTGLMGGSIALALRAQGWHVSGWDADPQQRDLALQLGVVDELDDEPRPTSRS
ncbi:MAG: NAD(P)-binding domain-containing protein [Microthrixaceae bacterium]